MPSRSAVVSAQRPFYSRHADAYDALVTDPVEPWVDAVDARLRREHLAPADLLDAGCGTGRHARAFADRGHRVALLDASADLLDAARARCPEADVWHADLCDPAIDRTFDAITCRGVLNDLVEDRERTAALAAFAALCRPGGLLVLDVREADASAARATGELQRRTAELADGGTLVFGSRSRWSGGRLLVEERYEATSPGGVVSVQDYAFAMRPWTRDELVAGLAAAGFGDVEVLPGVGRRTPDRLLVVARRA